MGRKKIPKGKKLVSVSFTITRDQYEKLQQFVNASVVVRLALDKYFEEQK